MTLVGRSHELGSSSIILEGNKPQDTESKFGPNQTPYEVVRGTWYCFSCFCCHPFFFFFFFSGGWVNAKNIITTLAHIFIENACGVFHLSPRFRCNSSSRTAACAEIVGSCCYLGRVSMLTRPDSENIEGDGRSSHEKKSASAGI